MLKFLPCVIENNEKETFKKTFDIFLIEHWLFNTIQDVKNDVLSTYQVTTIIVQTTQSHRSRPTSLNQLANSNAVLFQSRSWGNYNAKGSEWATKEKRRARNSCWFNRSCLTGTWRTHFDVQVMERNRGKLSDDWSWKSESYFKVMFFYFKLGK